MIPLGIEKSSSETYDRSLAEESRQYLIRARTSLRERHARIRKTKLEQHDLDECRPRVCEAVKGVRPISLARLEEHEVRRAVRHERDDRHGSTSNNSQ